MAIDPPERSFPLPGGNHALLIGEVLGSLMKAGLDARPEQVGGNHTNRIIVQRPSGPWYVYVEPAEGTRLD